MRRFIVLALAAGVAGVGTFAVAWTASSSPHRSTTPSPAEQRILKIALKAAARAGDPSPVLIQHGSGTRHRANLVASGDGVSGSQWSYLIAERGHFVTTDAQIPGPAAALRGTVITIIVNARTGEITDSGFSGPYPHLAMLGPVHTDLRR
jgi:hypothetical protein